MGHKLTRDTSKREQLSVGDLGLAGPLARQETFPYDVLDEIFCFACENRLGRALDLGTVCRFWCETIECGRNSP
jgi:hypothetical protein